jgi:hypothetical protein
MLTTDSFESNEKVILSIFATTGQLMYSESHQLSSHGKQSIMVNTGNILQPGSYFVVLTGNSKTVKAKLVISR